MTKENFNQKEIDAMLNRCASVIKSQVLYYVNDLSRGSTLIDVRLPEDNDRLIREMQQNARKSDKKKDRLFLAHCKVAMMLGQKMSWICDLIREEHKLLNGKMNPKY